MSQFTRRRVMKIGIIGAGHIGGTAAQLFIDAGHEIAISNSRGPETLRDLIATLGPNARAMTPAEAARFGEVVLVAVPLKDYTDLPVDDLRGKVVIDAMNYYPGRDGQYAQLDSGAMASSEMVAAHLTGARVVKAFNTIWFEHLKTQGKKNAAVGERRVIFVSGDDAEAKRIVSDLIEEIGFGPYDLGTLHDSQQQQPDTKVYNRDMTVDQASAELKS
jgi:8-hydroxy-5-deazaflavin:NADPH oxidoreductase